MSFSINTNGILEVTADVKDAQISNKLTIKQNKGTLTEDQVAKMTNEAKHFEEAHKSST